MSDQRLTKLLWVGAIFSALVPCLFAVAADDLRAKAAALGKQAAQLYEQGHYVEAESLFEQSLAWRRSMLPLDELEVAESLNGLAEVYVAESRYAEAEK